MMADTVDGSRDYIGRPPGDRDTEYVWGIARGRLSTVEQGNLTVMRGRVMDTRAGEHGNCADGDIAVPFEQTPSGLFVPIKEEPNAK